MLRPALLLSALLLTLAPLSGASVVETATDPVEVRECHSQYESFQVYVDDEPATHCFVLCCDEANAASTAPPPEVRPCPGGYYVVWDPYFITTCIPVPVGGGPQVESCGNNGYRVVWEPFFETVCFESPLQGGPEVRPCPGGYYVVWDPYFITTCLP